MRKAYNELYAAVIDKKVAMKMGPGDWRWVQCCAWALLVGADVAVGWWALPVGAAREVLMWQSHGVCCVRCAPWLVLRTTMPTSSQNLTCPLGCPLPAAPPRMAWMWGRKSGPWCTAAFSLRCGRPSSTEAEREPQVD